MPRTALTADQIQGRLGCIEREGATKRPLDAISHNDRAIDALAELRLTEDQLDAIVVSIIQADEIARTLGIRLEKEKAMRRSIEKLGQAVDDLAAFVKNFSSDKPDPLRAFINIHPEQRRMFNQAFYELRLLLKDRDQVAVQTAVRLGATRKRNMKKASLNAGIGWLAASIKTITGRPHVGQACLLSEVLFGIPEVSEDRLIGAMRNITDRNWRQS
jgi:hypothetical protein